MINLISAASNVRLQSSGLVEFTVTGDLTISNSDQFPFSSVLMGTNCQRVFAYFPLLAATLLLGLLHGCNSDSTAKNKTLRLATTTSTRDSGLLDVLIPAFQQRHEAGVDVIAVGTGKALKLGEAGDVDAVLVHARVAEDSFMAAGHGVRREDVMFNTFELLGPPDDPAKIRGMEPHVALQEIAAGGHRFVSRGDDSGTHKRELLLWEKAGNRPDWPEYMETGQGMGATVFIADQMQGYAICDRGTFLSVRGKIDLVPLTKQTVDMRNFYGIIAVNPDKNPAVNSELAGALVDFLISAEVQSTIADFQVDGEPLFIPLHPTSVE